MKIEILAHRGWWLEAPEKNQAIAFERAFAVGYGVETDVRDTNGRLVISHDMAQADAMPFERFLDIYRSHGSPGWLALNVKSDGLHVALGEALRGAGIDRYFVFDMSVPDGLHYLKGGLTTFTRRSEYEIGSSLDASAAGIWWDCFESGGDAALAGSALRSGKVGALVSPELHHREHCDVWQTWRDDIEMAVERSALMLCTDFPEEADRFFNRFGADTVFNND
ncbi:hypothetical protein D3C72_556300 [compost metagenome]